MRSISSTLTLLLLLAVAAGADEEAGEVLTWDGYLYRESGENGRILVGWPVVAMGVMQMPPHVVEGEITSRLAPLVSEAQDQYVFWNYDLERGGAPRARLPRVLVRLEGRVTHVGHDTSRGWSSSAGERRMANARLVDVEFVPDAWLDHWAVFFREKASPFQIRLDRKKPTPAERAAFARLAFATLKKMRAMPGSGEGEQKRIARIEPRAKIVERHRRTTELEILRWLRKEDETVEGLGLIGLDELGSVPPTGLELQRLFLTTETKKAFLGAVRKIWSGDLELIILPFYVKDDASTSWTTADLSEVEASWSEADYARNRKTTREMVGR